MKKSLLSKIIIYSVSVFLGAILLAVVICTIANVKRTLRITTGITKSATQTVAQIADKYDIEKLAQAPDSAEYQELEAILRTICNNDGVEYIYIYIPDLDRNELTYVIGVASDERKSSGTLEISPAGEIMEHQFSDGEINAWNGKTEGLSSPRENPQYGRQMCTYALITDSDNNRIALVGADYSIDKIYQEIISDTVLKIFKVFIVLAGIFAVSAFFLKKRIYDPITFLFQNMKDYISNKTDSTRSFEAIKLDTNDEIQHLADYFNELVLDIDDYADKIKDFASQQAKADTELDVARRIQYGIVGQKKDLCLANSFMVSARMQSARQVGGDFYDSFTLKDGKVCAFIGDVSGKGIAAALFMVFVKTLMREKITDIPDLALAVNEINREICTSNPEGMFVTSFIAVFDQTSGSFQYVNAGHNKPVIISNGKADLLESQPDIALGVFDDSEYRQHEIDFSFGDIIYLYTDGVTEAINSDKNFYGIENLLKACDTSEKTAAGVCREVIDSMKAFIADNTEQFDDITMLAVEQCGKSMELSCDLSQLGSIREYIFKLPVDNSMRKKVYLACEEIFSNIVNYSGANCIQFCYNWDADKVHVIFTDNGKSFNPLEENNEKAFEDYDEGGMGISLVKDLCSDIHYSHIDGKNILSMEFINK